MVVARTEFVKKHPEAVSDFLERYASSVDFVNADTDQAAKLVGQYEIVTEEVAKKHCRNVTLSASQGRRCRNSSPVISRCL